MSQMVVWKAFLRFIFWDPFALRSDVFLARLSLLLTLSAGIG
ncbi:hypothetical protein NHE_0787 [Neorickettsia helminthoeca str. Oregon]|uniref:Uncharacterized protein n=1 Tax=Neorickettsia helminthoeca str. Oregon TaxID=1286528 RepID=X5HKV9_9RICK|nr:hypothetical protein NHE_0787 [Neorickettsia helminthoeca str. Oregon]